MVKLRLVISRLIAALHCRHSASPNLLHALWAQLLIQGMDLPPPVPHEVNVARAKRLLFATSHQVHLHHVGVAEMIAADHFYVTQGGSPGFASLITMQAAFTLALDVVHR